MLFISKPHALNLGEIKTSKSFNDFWMQKAKGLNLLLPYPQEEDTTANINAYDRLQAKLAELNGGLDGGLIKEPLCDAGEVSQPVVNERIQEAHQDKLAPMMMLFTEGTTTNGDYILPFKTGTFLAKAPVLPIILKYPYERFSRAWDSISGARHVILLMCQFVNYMTVTRLPVYYHSQEEKDDPKLYAENVRRWMAREGKEIGLAEKRVYHAALNGRPTVLLQKED
ncbi:hypothetical protein Tco_1086839 [Tanacetum coccineum]